ncbi:HupE/UreJ family protein [Anianabacter salinae]|uniref:HupE/UreJ family protein n=1 Tax=Anianabacter salinae TaxID=2851023 RepID=UPI00225E2B99|nr:HupE/UreJ family protein [Anianabacter salinae]MBV0910763.1 HupE/UreJ family protein [Anianabacter salinae]
MKKLITLAAILAATPALAHHPLGGLPMETFAQGVMSGVGHPVLGFDHLFFVALAGVAAMLAGLRLAGPGAYVGAMLVGCAATYAGLALPAVEVVIALSLLALGLVVASGKLPGTPVLLAIFAGFGLFHGAAFAGSIVGQEGGVGSGVLTGYLIGLGAVQYAVALGAGYAAEKLLGATAPQATGARLVGAMVAGIGLFLTLEAAEGPLLAAAFGV